MKDRQTGFYWVCEAGVWLVAEYVACFGWKLITGLQPMSWRWATDDAFEAIDEQRLSRAEPSFVECLAKEKEIPLWRLRGQKDQEKQDALEAARSNSTKWIRNLADHCDIHHYRDDDKIEVSAKQLRDARQASGGLDEKEDCHMTELRAAFINLIGCKKSLEAAVKASLGLYERDVDGHLRTDIARVRLVKAQDDYDRRLKAYVIE